jgi:hypothetical protein
MVRIFPKIAEPSKENNPQESLILPNTSPRERSALMENKDIVV